ncbi:MAG: nucleotidyl transferase AbiEii/AbiGii toxin family protein [Prevotella sp.]|nr:nucleotidyl transferase AbiEii/AbiGii toxin family protein [Prevotella sp.]
MNSEHSKSLAPHTGKVFEVISRLECIKQYTLVGGTALSLQIAKRQSEDFDFMKWLGTKREKPEVDWPAILKEFESVGKVNGCEVGGFDFFSLNFESVKVSFYAAPRKAVPTMVRIPFLNNLYLADIESIGVMKMETMLRRAKFRDYYDIYTILEQGYDIWEMIEAALAHSEHKLKTRGLLAMLSEGKRFVKEKGFEELNPVYDITPLEIQEYIKAKLLEKKQ